MLLPQVPTKPQRSSSDVQWEWLCPVYNLHGVGLGTAFVAARKASSTSGVQPHAAPPGTTGTMAAPGGGEHAPIPRRPHSVPPSPLRPGKPAPCQCLLRRTLVSPDRTAPEDLTASQARPRSRSPPLPTPKPAGGYGQLRSDLRESEASTLSSAWWNLVAVGGCQVAKSCATHHGRW